jgi:hypothetical protein
MFPITMENQTRKVFKQNEHHNAKVKDIQISILPLLEQLSSS